MIMVRDGLRESQKHIGMNWLLGWLLLLQNCKSLNSLYNRRPRLLGYSKQTQKLSLLFLLACELLLIWVGGLRKRCRALSRSFSSHSQTCFRFHFRGCQQSLIICLCEAHSSVARKEGYWVILFKTNVPCEGEGKKKEEEFEEWLSG